MKRYNTATDHFSGLSLRLEALMNHPAWTCNIRGHTKKDGNSPVLSQKTEGDKMEGGVKEQGTVGYDR